MVLLEIVAVALAFMQMLGGVRTDEAKYLLNIPYPHPPLVRWILSQTEWIPFQEWLWRIIFATLMVQAVWIVMGLECTKYQKSRNTQNSISNNERPVRSEHWILGNEISLFFDIWGIFVGACWLFSSAVLLQSGTIMMAPLTALQSLVFLWLLSNRSSAERHRGFVALFWLASLFTAYQIVLFAPLVIALFWRMKIPLWQKALYVLLPFLLLIIYTFVNPLALSSMFVHGSKDLSETLIERFLRTGKVWGLGGSFLISLLGTIGIFHTRRWELIASFLLVLAFVALARFEYYAILFTPLFAVGCGALLLSLQRINNLPFTISNQFAIRNLQFAILMLLLLGTTVTLWFFPPSFKPGPSRSVMQLIIAQGKQGSVLINGPFGHEWQYESPFPVRRYVSGFVTGAQAIVCLRPCENIPQKDFTEIASDPVPVWMHN